MDALTISDSCFNTGIPISQHCIARGKIIHFKRKQIIFEVGTVLNQLYYILSGTVRVVDLSEESDRLILFTIPQDHFVCDVRFLADLPLSFQVESLTDVTLVAFSRETTLELMSHDAGFRQSLFTGIAKKMRMFGANSVKTAYEDNSTRLLHLLKTSASLKNGQSTIRISQQELAEHLGVHRVTVNRTLRKLQSQGLLRIDREHITLL